MNIKYIRRYLISRIGSKVIIIYYGSRNKRERYEGILHKMYQNVFTIRLSNGEIKSFTYIDIITKTIKIYIWL